MDLFGGQTRAATCKLDLDAMAKTGMPISRILKVFEGENVNLPAGAISLEDRYIVLHAPCKFESLADIENVLIGYKENVPIFLGNIAEISLDHLPREEYFRTGAADGVQLSIRKQSGHNKVEIKQKIKEQMVRVKKALPASISITIRSDQSKQIIGSIGSAASAPGREVSWPFLFFSCS